MNTSTYLARCDELSRLLQRLLAGLPEDGLRYADRQRLSRLLRRLAVVAQR
jgi:hypothetical protein